ncbi:hypothetical protein POM88_026825 [Heracleum sosnowskyi]|uniref:MULE transposase domain-containing protein n=1 Tax=Heracleum sosnowskyi TaxID=360622 RepID=A0AAD8I7T2_9APIA|nr:hypothetical protein POM88_026825 [Heracleum sosnowskyi]
MDNITDEEQEAPQSSDIDRELLELNEVIDLIKSNSIEHISELLQPINSNNTNNTGCNMESQREDDEHRFGISKFLSIALTRYSDREKLITCIREVAATLGYAIVIKKSKKDSYVRIGCDRGGEYRSSKIPIKKRDTTSKRTTGTRLIQCPFEIWGRWKPGGIWVIEIKNLTHNHDGSNDMSSHPSHRRFSRDEFIRIREMTMSGIAPRQILTSLRQSNANIQSISRSIYNARAKIRKDSLQGCTVIQALYQELGQGEFIYDVKHDHEGHLTHLLIAHPSSVALRKNYPFVFLMDCTYKINKYRMPLLNIVGVTSFNTTFFSAVIFLQKEEITAYVWALQSFNKILGLEAQPLAIVTDRELALMNAIKEVFPNTSHLLCVWHIEKNLLAKCKKKFKTKEEWDEFITSWTSVIKSSDIASFDSAWGVFVEQYKDQKDQIVGHVSVYALGELLKQYELAKSTILPPCRGNFTTSMGLPCVHNIRERVQPLQLTDVHPQWRLDIRSLTMIDNENEDIEGMLKKVYENYKKLPLSQKKDICEQVAKIAEVSIPSTLEPITRPYKGRPPSSFKRGNESSTTCDPSLFEIVEKAHKMRKRIYDGGGGLVVVVMVAIKMMVTVNIDVVDWWLLNGGGFGEKLTGNYDGDDEWCRGGRRKKGQ